MHSGEEGGNPDTAQLIGREERLKHDRRVSLIETFLEYEAGFSVANLYGKAQEVLLVTVHPRYWAAQTDTFHYV